MWLLFRRLTRNTSISMRNFSIYQIKHPKGNNVKNHAWRTSLTTAKKRLLAKIISRAGARHVSDHAPTYWLADSGNLSDSANKFTVRDISPPKSIAENAI